MTDVTSKTLHEKTRQLLDRARQGERFRVLRDGRPDAFLIPAAEAIDPEWPEIMADVWEAQKASEEKRPNPVLRERRSRKYAARLPSSEQSKNAKVAGLRVRLFLLSYERT